MSRPPKSLPWKSRGRSASWLDRLVRPFVMLGRLQRFKSLGFVYGMHAHYQDAMYRVVAVNFDERLLGLDDGEPDLMWIRAENADLYRPNRKGERARDLEGAQNQEQTQMANTKDKNEAQSRDSLDRLVGTTGPYARMRKAFERNTGMRLSADDVQKLMLGDTAIYDAVMETYAE